MEAMEAWPHADERVMQRSYNEQACISCAWFTYGMDGHCHTVVRCALQEAQPASPGAATLSEMLRRAPGPRGA